MKPRIFIVLFCALLAACATDDIRVTGISRERAIAIAKGSCREYPGRYSYVNRADWLYGPHCWRVDLTNYGGSHGKSYRINHASRVISVAQIGSQAPERHYYQRRYYYQEPYRYRRYYSAPARDYSDVDFYFRDGDYYAYPGRHRRHNDW